MHIQRKYPVLNMNEWLEVIPAMDQLTRMARNVLADGVKTRRGVYYPLSEEQLNSLCVDDDGRVSLLTEIIKVLPNEIWEISGTTENWTRDIVLHSLPDNRGRAPQRGDRPPERAPETLMVESDTKEADSEPLFNDVMVCACESELPMAVTNELSNGNFARHIQEPLWDNFDNFAGLWEDIQRWSPIWRNSVLP